MTWAADYKYDRSDIKVLEHKLYRYFNRWAAGEVPVSFIGEGLVEHGDDYRRLYFSVGNDVYYIKPYSFELPMGIFEMGGMRTDVDFWEKAIIWRSEHQELFDE
jgi:hypothetical protein